MTGEEAGDSRILSMAFFARRALKLMLADLSSAFRSRQLKAMKGHLNTLGERSITAQFELAVLYGLSKEGSVVYEPSFGGSSKPDIYFDVGADCEDQFVAEVTCISQRNLASRLYVRHFQNELARICNEYAVSPAGIHGQFQGEVEGENFFNRRARIRIPLDKARITEILSARLPELIAKISCNPANSYSTSIIEPDMPLTLTYTPGQFSFGVGHISDDVPYSLEENHLFRALADKAIQLDRSNYPGATGIFVCDTGASVFWRTSGSSGLSPDQIVSHFFKLNPRVSFLVTVDVDDAHRWRPYSFGNRGDDPIRLRALTYFNNKGSYRLSPKVEEALGRFISHLPSVRNNGRNAIARLESQERVEGITMPTIQMSERRVRFSARDLLELLAGRLSAYDFNAKYGFDSGRLIDTNPFLNALEQGRLIAGLKFEPCPSEDDDWCEVTFGHPDPAISKL